MHMPPAIYAQVNRDSSLTKAASLSFKYYAPPSIDANSDAIKAFLSSRKAGSSAAMLAETDALIEALATGSIDKVQIVLDRGVVSTSTLAALDLVNLRDLLQPSNISELFDNVSKKRPAILKQAIAEMFEAGKSGGGLVSSADGFKATSAQLRSQMLAQMTRMLPGLGSDPTRLFGFFCDAEQASEDQQVLTSAEVDQIVERFGKSKLLINPPPMQVKPQGLTPISSSYGPVTQSILDAVATRVNQELSAQGKSVQDLFRIGSYADQNGFTRAKNILSVSAPGDAAVYGAYHILGDLIADDLGVDISKIVREESMKKGIDLDKDGTGVAANKYLYEMRYQFLKSEAAKQPNNGFSSGLGSSRKLSPIARKAVVLADIVELDEFKVLRMKIRAAIDSSPSISKQIETEGSRLNSDAYLTSFVSKFKSDTKVDVWAEITKLLSDKGYEASFDAKAKVLRALLLK